MKEPARAALLAGLTLSLAGCLHPPPPPPPLPLPERVAAVSDLHLGDPRSLLDDDDGLDWFASIVETAVREDGVRTLVIDGDVLELSLASETSAFSAARALFGRLAAIDGLQRVVVVAGNHDHRLYEWLPGTPDEKLDHSFTEGTRLHEELAPVLGALSLTVVYPDFSLETGGGTVHFSHGHYYDPWTMPRWGRDIADIEAANASWLGFVTAGGGDPATRLFYRRVYDLGQHFSGLLARLEGAADPPPSPDANDREMSRVRAWAAMLHDPRAIAIVSGHTHHAGGLETSVEVEGRTIGFYDLGGFVASHTGRAIRPWMAEVDVPSGAIRLLPVAVPEGLGERAEDRAFSRLP